jgi:hypothetical protein
MLRKNLLQFFAEWHTSCKVTLVSQANRYAGTDGKGIVNKCMKVEIFGFKVVMER